MKQLLLLLSLLSLCCAANAQTIMGRTLDSSNNPLPYVNIAVYSRNEGKIVTGTTSAEDGSFHIILPANISNQLTIVASCIGMVNDTVQVSGSQEVLTFVLQSDMQMLSEVNITAYKQAIKVESGTITANVEHSVLAKYGRIDELMNKIPFVNSKDCNMTVFGRGDAEVYIDERKIFDNKILKQLPPDQIKKIEVITNPDSRYGSDVNAVIKIFTVEKQEGFGCSIDYTIMANTKLSNDVYATLIYNKGKWQLTGNFQIADYYEKERNYEQTDINVNQSSLESDYYNEYTCKINSAGAGANYAISDNSNIGFSLSLFKSEETNGYCNYLKHSVNHIIDFEDTTNNPVNSVPKYTFAKFYYTNKLKNTTLDFSNDYVAGHTTRENRYTESEAEVDGRNKSDYRMLSTIIDFNTEINDRFSVNYGAELTYTDDKQDFDYNQKNIATEMTASGTERRQLLNGEYINLKYILKKLTLTAGIRYEHTDLSYYSQGTKDNSLSRRYNDMLPSANINYSITDDIDFSAGYRATIQRPVYNTLSDRLTLSDRYTYSQGNPLLKPFYKKSINGLITIFDFSIISSFNRYQSYISTDNFISQNNGNVLIEKYINLESFYRNTIGVEWNYGFDFYEPTIEINFTHQYLNGTFEGQEIEYKTPVWEFSISNTFFLPWDLMLELDMGYKSRGHNIFYYNHESWTSSIDIMKDFDCGISLDLMFDNYFVPQNMISESKRNNIYTYSNGDSFVPEISLTISYSVNNFKKKYNGKNKSSEISRLDNK